MILNELSLMIKALQTLHQTIQWSCSSSETIVLSKLMVTFLKNETYGYGSQYSLKNLWSVYPTVTWYGISFN